MRTACSAGFSTGTRLQRSSVTCGEAGKATIIEAPLKPDCAECSEGVVFSDGAQKRTVYVTTPM